VWPVALLALIAVVATVAALLVRRGTRARPTRIDAAWNCGRLVQSPRAEYTAASFAEPLRRVFTGFYRPTLEVDVDVHPVSPYFVRSMGYRGRLAPWMEQIVYDPILRVAEQASRAAARLQSGSIHLYLSLLPAALVFLLVLSRWVR
jgi:hypothetical protein